MTDVQDLRRPPICAWYAIDGYCRWGRPGQRCRFAHPKRCMQFAYTDKCDNPECSFIHTKFVDEKCRTCGGVTRVYANCKNCRQKFNDTEDVVKQ